jgi:polygalacturonase
VGDGVTSNTAAFRRAVAALEERAGGGGARLEVPPGRWLTGSFNLTSRFTLFLHHGAVILGSQVRDPAIHNPSSSNSSSFSCFFSFNRIYFASQILLDY